MQKRINEFAIRSEEALNKTLIDYEESPPGARKNLLGLMLQLNIFRYDICRELMILQQTKASGFAECVALKTLILRLHEFDKFSSEHLISKLVDYANSRGAELSTKELKSKQKNWHDELKKIRSWVKARNEAAHYKHDIDSQIEILKSINKKEVLRASAASLRFNAELLRVVRTSPRQKTVDSDCGVREGEGSPAP